jgi:hypothetical protein
MHGHRAHVDRFAQFGQTACRHSHTARKRSVSDASSPTVIRKPGHASRCGVQVTFPRMASREKTDPAATPEPLRPTACDKMNPR